MYGLQAAPAAILGPEQARPGKKRLLACPEKFATPPPLCWGRGSSYLVPIEFIFLKMGLTFVLWIADNMFMAYAGVTVQDEAELQAAGLWDRFLSARKHFMQNGDNDPDMASVKSKALFMRHGKAYDPDRTLVNSDRKAERARVKEEQAKLRKLEKLEKLEKEGKWGKLPRKGVVVDDSMQLAVAPDGLSSRSASELEIARWVSRNIDNPSADPSDCPDPFAWTLLRMCRSDPGMSTMFVKDIWTKLLTQSAKRVEEDRVEIDGSPTIELISRIQAASDVACG